ncbi:MAG TPA: YfhO family protein [Pirellulales bacterium]|nr:YfhO family protein [Pirellulales bacterium]
MSSVDADGRRNDATEHDQERKLSAWIQLAALASFAALAAPFFLGRVYVADDLGEFHLPLRNFYTQQLAEGEPFDWMPGLYGGFYVAAEGQLGAYHPLHLLLYRWLPLGAAFDLELLVSYPFMFAGMYFFLRRMLRRRDAASYGALVFTFCGFNLLHFVHPNAVAIVAHIPWLLLSIEVALGGNSRRGRARAELGIAILTASQLLLGYPQYVWFSLLLEVAYFVWRAIGVGVQFRAAGWVVVAKICGLLCGATQWLPTFDALSDSLRRAPDAAFASTGSLHPLNLVQLLGPYLFRTRVVGQNTHELGLYAGAAPLLLCVWLAAEHRSWGRLASHVRACFAFGAFSLMLAMGEFGGLYHLQSLLPLANRFRFPCRAIGLLQFCIAIGAALALALLLKHSNHGDLSADRRRRRPLVIAFLVSLGLAIAGPVVWPEFVAGPMLVACGPLLIGGAAALIARAERGSRGALVALVFFTGLDLSCYGLSYSVYPHTADLHEFVAKIQLPPEQSSARIVVAESAHGLRAGDRMLLAGLERIDGYAGLEPAKRLDYKQVAALKLAGVGWIFNPNTNHNDARQRWTNVRPSAPRAWLASKIVSNAKLCNMDALGLHAAAVDDPISLPASLAGSARVTRETPGQITINTHADTRQLLVTTESFHPGWQAVVDGWIQGVVRVNGDFLGCLLEAGEHRVELQFRPPSRRIGGAISGCGLGLMLCIFWLRCRGCAQSPEG